MAAEDYFYGGVDPYDDPDEDGVVCKYCKCKQLEWVQVRRQWRLVDENGEFHNCRAVASPSEFKAIA